MQKGWPRWPSLALPDLRRQTVIAYSMNARAELHAYHILGYVKMFSPNVLDKYPVLAKMYASVENLPNIAKWLEERPKTEF